MRHATGHTTSLLLGLCALVLTAVPGTAGRQGTAAQAPPPGQTQTGRAGQPSTTPAQNPAGARGQQRDNTTQPAVGTGAISGSVITDGTGAPVRRARVMLNGAELRGSRSAVTDDQGRFAFATLPAGRYTLSASKPGYVNIAYGAKKPGRAGTPIQLAEGQQLEKATLKLPKGSVVTGVVVDENGEPSPGTQVRVMRFVTQTGEKTLQQSGQDQTDDRGIYRIYGLQPGDYIVSAAPQNTNIDNLQQTIMAQVEAAMQQAQAAGGPGRAGGGGGRAAGALADLANFGPGRGQQLLDRAQQLQQQLQGTQPDQTVGYAPVYFPGTTTPVSAATVTLSVGEERAGIDFQLQLVPTAKVAGTIAGPDGTVPPGTQIVLAVAGQQNMPAIPGVSNNTARADQAGKFSFSNITPGQYSLMARAAVRDPNAAAAEAGGRGAGDAQGRAGRPGGPGGRGGPGTINQVLWAMMDVTVSGQNLNDLALTLQPGMTLAGRVAFDTSATLPLPMDLTRVRVMLNPTGQQQMEIGGPAPPAQVDATGHFTIAGVAPGKYTLRGNVPPAAQTGAQTGAAPAGQAGQAAQAGGRGGGRGGGGGVAGGVPGAAGGNWVLKSAIVRGRDTLDFPAEIGPNESVTDAVLTFTDKTQELSGTLQDSSGRPTADFTIVVFPIDNRYWLPQSRRIASSRPSTDGKFTFRGLPPGDYRLTAVIDAESGEWYDPAFLAQLVNVSLPFSLAAGEKKTQDLKLAGGGL